jgi:hypothetical protein
MNVWDVLPERQRAGPVSPCTPVEAAQAAARYQPPTHPKQVLSALKAIQRIAAYQRLQKKFS